MEASEQFQDYIQSTPEPYLVQAEDLADEKSGEETVHTLESDITPLDHGDGPDELIAAELSLVESPEYDELPLNPKEHMSDTVTEFLKVARKYPLLKPKQEVDLAKRIERGDLDAKELLVASNLRLVASNAVHYQGNGLTLDDLVQEGLLGLIRASEKFDYRRGFRFSTYATVWIRQAIQRGLENTRRTIRIPIHVTQRMRKLDKAERELIQILGVEPTVEELAAATGIELEKIIEVRELAIPIISLNQTAEDGVSELGDIVAVTADTAEQADDQGRPLRVLQIINGAKVEGTLDNQEVDVLLRRYGLGANHAPQTQKIIAHDLEISTGRVAQIEQVALDKLKPWFAEERST